MQRITRLRPTLTRFYSSKQELTKLWRDGKLEPLHHYTPATQTVIAQIVLEQDRQQRKQELRKLLVGNRATKYEQRFGEEDRILIGEIRQEEADGYGRVAIQTSLGIFGVGLMAIAVFLKAMN